MNRYNLSTLNGITSIEQDPDVGPEWDEDEWTARIEHKQDLERDEHDDYQAIKRDT